MSYPFCVQSIIFFRIFSISDVFTSVALTSHECKNNNNTNINDHKKLNINSNSNIIINNNLLRNGNGDVEINDDKHDYESKLVSFVSMYSTLAGCDKTTINNNKNYNQNNNNNSNNVNLNAKNDNVESKRNFTTFDDLTITGDTDFFAAFNENFGKNRRNSRNAEMVDAFGVGFNSNSMAQHGDGNLKNNNYNNLRASTKHTTSPLTTDCLDNFEHKFVNLNVYDANESKLGFDDDDGFADFSAFNATNQITKPDLLPHSIEVKTKTSPRKLNPIRGSDFEKLNANTTVDAAAKIIPKYSFDYSKSDQFEDDLQAALQRSLVDQ